MLRSELGARSCFVRALQKRRQSFGLQRHRELCGKPHQELCGKSPFDLHFVRRGHEAPLDWWIVDDVPGSLGVMKCTARFVMLSN